MKAKKANLHNTFRLAIIASLVILGVFASIVASSYILAGWLMRPNADDYNALMAYHTGGLGWLTSLPHTVITGGGRYGQTFVSVIMYGSLGIHILHFTAILSVSLFVIASFLAVYVWQKESKKIDFKIAILGSLILFLIYSAVSVTLPAIRGNLDNSFQDFIWLPGFITYTLPLELAVILVSITILFRRTINTSPLWLLVLGLFAIGLGTFDEILPVVYTEFSLLLVAYTFLKHHFQVRAAMLWLREYLHLYIINVGLIIGLVLNYSSAATGQRIATIHASAPLRELIAHTLRSTERYIFDRAFGTTAADYNLAFVVIVGMVIGAFAVSNFGRSHITARLKAILPIWLLTLVMAVSSLIICFAEVFKGYGLSSYLQPRFEIFYNSWFAISLILTGMVLFNALLIILGERNGTKILPYLGILLALIIVLDIPRIMSQASTRFETVAVFSHNWDAQNQTLSHDASLHLRSVSVPGIDVGDGYLFETQCSNTPASWLEISKQDYYHIPRICMTE